LFLLFILYSLFQYYVSCFIIHLIILFFLTTPLPQSPPVPCTWRQGHPLHIFTSFIIMDAILYIYIYFHTFHINISYFY
jgi:hypothetical protein